MVVTNEWFKKKVNFTLITLIFLILISVSVFATTYYEDTGLSPTEDTTLNWLGAVIQPIEDINITAIKNYAVADADTADTCKIFAMDGTQLNNASTVGTDANFSTPTTLTADTNYIVACGDADNSHNHYGYANTSFPIVGTKVKWVGGMTAIAADGSGVKTVVYDQEFAVRMVTLVTLAGSTANTLSGSITAPTSASKWNGTKTITATLKDTNVTYNNHGLKIYYSNVDSNFENEIYTDTNLADGSGVTCTDYNFQTEPTCSYSWTIPETIPDGNYSMDMNFYNDVNHVVLQTDFNISQPLIKFTFFDENTGEAITATLDFNGTQYTGTSFSMNAIILMGDTNINAKKTFSISATGYSTRYYQADLNKYSDLNIGFMLLPTSQTYATKFKFYAPDEITSLPNVYIEVRNAAKQYKYAGRYKTDASAFIDFNLNTTDSNYTFRIYTDTNVYDYNGVSVSILKPMDETTLITIDANWSYNITGVTSISDTNIDLDSTVIVVYSNTHSTYDIKISSLHESPSYSSRTYQYKLLGNPGSQTLQPYLTPEDDTTLFTINTLQQYGIDVKPLPSISISIYRGATLVQQVVTDTAGQALAQLVTGDTYKFYIYKDGNLQLFNGVDYAVVNVSSSARSFILTVSGLTIYKELTQKLTPVTYTPNQGSLVKATAGTQTFTQTIYNLGGNPISVTSKVIENGHVFATSSYSSSDSNTLSQTINWADINVGYVTVWVKVTIDGNSYDYNFTYRVISGFGGQDLLTILREDVKTDFGCSATGVCSWLLGFAIIASLVLLLIVSWFTAWQLGGQATGIIFAISMSLFAYLYWVPLTLIAVIWLLIAGFIINERRQ